MATEELSGRRYVVPFVGGFLLVGDVAARLMSRESPWPLAIGLAGGAAAIALVRWLERRERRRQTP